MTLLGIDIGGSGIKGAPVDVEAGQMLAERFRIETPHPAVPAAVAEIVAQVAANFNYSGPVGITFPAVVKNGVTMSAANVDVAWIGANAAELFSQRLGAPATVVNDADAAGVAEMRFGAGREQRGVTIMLTLGTGIGSAIFVDGKLVPNTEFGHLDIRGKDAEKRASDKTREDKGLSWEHWSARLSEFIGHLDKLFSPDLYIIGGGVSKKSDKFLPFIQAKTAVKIVPAAMRNEAGIIGAAYLAQVSPSGTP